MYKRMLHFPNKKAHPKGVRSALLFFYNDCLPPPSKFSDNILFLIEIPPFQ